MNITKGSCNWIFELPQLGRDALPIPMQSATCYVISLCHTRTHAHTHTWRGCKCDNIRIFNSQKLGPNLRQTDNRNFLSLLRLLLRFFLPTCNFFMGQEMGGEGVAGPVTVCSHLRLWLQRASFVIIQIPFDKAREIFYEVVSRHMWAG